MEYYLCSQKEVFERLKASDKGLSSAEAVERLKIYCPNNLKEGVRVSPLVIFLSQFASPLVWILFGAMAISLFVGEFVDFYVIGAIVVINAILGFVQEYRAERAIEALKKMISLKATVFRDGEQCLIDSGGGVPGGVVI